MSALAPKTGRSWRAALALLGILLIAVNLRVALSTVAPVLVEIRRDLDLTATSAGLLLSLPMLAFALFSPLAPPVANRIGLERTLWLSVTATGAGILLRSSWFVGGIWTGTVLLGIGIAFLNVLLPSLVKRDFPRRVGQVTGIYFAFQGTVAAVATGLVVPIAEGSPLGWRLALGIWAGLALLAMAWLLPRLRSRAGITETVDTHDTPPVQQPRPLFKSALAWQITVFMGLQSASYFVFASWLPSVEQSHGVSAEASGWHLFILQSVTVIGNLVTAWLLHRLRSQRAVVLTASVFATVAYAGLLLAPGLAVLWTVVVGLSSGSLIVVALSLFSMRSRSARQAAALSGMAQSFGYALAAASPILFGALRDMTGGWTVPLTATVALMLALCFFSVLVGRDRYV